MDTDNENKILNIATPKTNWHFALPKIKPPETPSLLFMQTQPKPLKYEETFWKKQADDIKQPFENQLHSLQIIADNTKEQANSLSEQVKVMREQLKIAQEETKSAKKDALFSKVVSIISILIALGSLIVAIIALT